MHSLQIAAACVGPATIAVVAEPLQGADLEFGLGCLLSIYAA
jgi:hypothetical protein